MASAQQGDSHAALSPRTDARGTLPWAAISGMRQAAHRNDAAPDISTATEAGLPGMVAQNLIGLYVPARTPQAIIEQLAQATRKVAADPDFQRQLSATGASPFPDYTPEKARQIVADEIARYTPAIKSIGLKLEL